MGIAKVTTNYQVTIPKDIRRIHGIKIGDTVLFAIEGNKIHFMNMDRASILTEIAGSWKNTIQGSSTGYVKELRSGWSKRTKRLGI
jgi:AbrB family looped-hinge helix DNA binding protein